VSDNQRCHLPVDVQGIGHVRTTAVNVHGVVIPDKGSALGIVRVENGEVILLTEVVLGQDVVALNGEDLVVLPVQGHGGGAGVERPLELRNAGRVELADDLPELEAVVGFRETEGVALD
jgi:hypothetical protein